MNPKQAAAENAISELPVHGFIGLGSGSTTEFFIRALAELIAQTGSYFIGVPTSQKSRVLAQSLGIPLVAEDSGPWSIDVTVDGADEVDEQFNLIKGGGGALTREKIVNFASAKNVCIVDRSKLSRQLGERWAVPIEVLRFGHHNTEKLLARWGKPTLRMQHGAPFCTDSNNYIYDVQTGPIYNPAQLDLMLRQIPGVVETGLFIKRVNVLFVADFDDVEKIDVEET